MSYKKHWKFNALRIVSTSLIITSPPTHKPRSLVSLFFGIYFEVANYSAHASSAEDFYSQFMRFVLRYYLFRYILKYSSIHKLGKIPLWARYFFWWRRKVRSFEFLQLPVFAVSKKMYAFGIWFGIPDSEDHFLLQDQHQFLCGIRYSNWWKRLLLYFLNF